MRPAGLRLQAQKQKGQQATAQRGAERGKSEASVCLPSGELGEKISGSRHEIVSEHERQRSGLQRETGAQKCADAVQADTPGSFGKV